MVKCSTKDDNLDIFGFEERLVLKKIDSSVIYEQYYIDIMIASIHLGHKKLVTVIIL